MKKVVLLIMLFFLLLTVGVWTYVQSRSFSALIRPYVVGPVSRLLGREANIGRIKANLLPLYIELRDIIVYDGGEMPALSLRKLRLYINPFPLIVRRISIPLIVLFEPRAYIARNASRGLNIDDMIRKMRSRIYDEGGDMSAVYQVSVRSVSIHRGRVVFEYRPGERMRLTEMNALIGLDLPARSVRLALNSCYVSLNMHADPIGRLTGSVLYSRGRFYIESMRFASGESHISAAGVIGDQELDGLRLKMTTRLKIKDLERFMKPPATHGGMNGAVLDATASITGTTKIPTVEGSLSIAGLSSKLGRLDNAGLSFRYFSGELNISGKDWLLTNGNAAISIERFESTVVHRGASFEIRRLEIGADDLNARISGSLDARQGLDLVFDIESSGEGRSLSYFTRVPLQGRVAVRGGITGPLSAPLLNGVLSAWPVTVRGITFDEVGGKVSYGNGKLALSSVEIRQQAYRYTLNGAIDLTGGEAVYDARLIVHESDVMSIVSMFYKKPLPIKLSAYGEITFTGTKKDFSGAAHLVSGPGTAYGEPFAKAELSVAITPTRISFPDVTIAKGAGNIKASGFIGFDRTYSASLKTRSIDLSDMALFSNMPFSGRFSLDVSSSGSFSAPSVIAGLNVPELFASGQSLGMLSANVRIDKGDLSFGMEAGQGTVKASGTVSLKQPHRWSMNGSVAIKDVDPFALLGKKALIGRGRLDMDGMLWLKGEGLAPERIDGGAEIRRIGLLIGDYLIQTDHETGFNISGGRLALKDTGLSGPGTRLFVSGFADLFRQLNFRFAGAADLSLLRLMYKEVEYSAGRAEASLTVTSDWYNPEVSGRLTIKDAEIKVKDVPQKFTGLSGAIELDGERILVQGISGSVGGGTMNLTGSVQLAGLGLRDFSFKTVFDEVTVRYPPGLTSTLSGELSYDGDSEFQILSGEVEIKRARYDTRIDWKSMLLDMAKGLYQKKKKDIAWIGGTEMNIRFSGKENIVLQNNLAKLNLSVDLFLRGTVDKPQIIGRVEAVRGVVYFRRNDFNILHASADFTEPRRINPILDILAETRVREYQVRLAVTGPADKANVTFISDPPLSDSDILSLLALGKTGSEIKGREAGVGMGEAASFATGQLQDIFERRARSLTGLDRFQVDPSLSRGDTSVPRVTVGKEVVPDRLFVTYSSNVGGLAPEPVFRIEYILNKSFSLVGERNEMGNISTDVKFRFEFE